MIAREDFNLTQFRVSFMPHAEMDAMHNHDFTSMPTSCGNPAFGQKGPKSHLRAKIST